MKGNLDSTTIRKFQRQVYAWFDREGRTLPWRTTKNPYRILVSEMMLQQTQVERVLPKYREFLRAFPTLRALSKASTGDVLRLWQGLGYNRRARFLKSAAEAAVVDFGGRLPADVDALQSLPGIGPYTARAIAAFAFQIPAVFIETNIRAVFMHHFFPGEEKVSDSDILPLVELTLDQSDPHRWYSALMDYGAALKRANRSITARSAHHVKQKPFKGSDREVRGAIIRILSSQPRGLAGPSLRRFLQQHDPQRIQRLVEKLLAEGLIEKKKGRLGLPA